MLQLQPEMPVFLHISKALGYDSPDKAVAAFREMMKQMELSNPVAVKRDTELELLSKSVNPVRMKNNPVLIDEELAWKLYNQILS